VYIDDTRALGAYPVLLTPIERRRFTGTAISASHGAYPTAMQEVAEKTSTPLIDMTLKTTSWLEALGPEASLERFAEADNTHLSAFGAREVAALVVEGIRERELPLAQALAE
jgi:lysophospholipase L1-like esterase